MEELEFLAGIISAGSADGTPSLPLVQQHLPHFIESHIGFNILVVTDATGRVVYDSANPGAGLSSEASVAGRDFYAEALSGRSTIDGSLLSRTNDRFLVLGAVPIQRDEKTIGVLFGPISFGDTLRSIAMEGYGFSGGIYILDRSDRLIVGSNPTIPTGHHFPPSRFPQTYEYQDDSGTWLLGVRLPLSIDDWSIVVETERSVALADSRDYVLILLLVGVIAVAFAILIGHSIATGVLRPIVDLTEISRLVAHREYRAAAGRDVTAKGPIELQSVVTTFQETVRALMHHMEQLEESTLTDYLTALPNRRYFERELYRNLKLCRREGWECTIMMLDLDHFKRINDSFGHAFGDRVLKQFSDTVSTTIRTSDLAARIGGEEFAILCPNTETTQALEVAERVRREVKALTFHPPGIDTEYRITVSVGVVVIPGHIIREDRMGSAPRPSGQSVV
jgi:diguanylate cyclase (GGDEF)-like protein